MNIPKSFLTNRTVVLHHGGMIFSEEREIVSLTAVVYRPRNPQLSDYYRCVEDYFETGFNPDFHILVTDGCFYGNKGMFRVAPPLELKKLLVPFRVEAIFRHKALRTSLNNGKITQE